MEVVNLKDYRYCAFISLNYIKLLLSKPRDIHKSLPMDSCQISQKKHTIIIALATGQSSVVTGIRCKT